MKNARFYLASIFILFGLICFGCSNAAGDSGTPSNNPSTPDNPNSTTTTLDSTSVTISKVSLSDLKGMSIKKYYNDDHSFKVEFEDDVDVDGKGDTGHLVGAGLLWGDRTNTSTKEGTKKMVFYPDTSELAKALETITGTGSSQFHSYEFKEKNPLYKFEYDSKTMFYNTSMILEKETSSTGLAGTYKKDNFTCIINSDGTVTILVKTADEEQETTGTITNNKGILTLEFSGKEENLYLLYTQDGKLLGGELLEYAPLGTAAATPAQKGISVTIDVPEGCPIVYFYRQKKGSNYMEAWYCTEKATTGKNTVIDYFVEGNTNYTYWAEFRDSNWTLKGNSSSIEVTSSGKGFDLPIVTNTPKATYNSETGKITFSTKPTFSYTESPLEEYPNLKIEMLYKCDENTYENICEYKLGEEQTEDLYSWIPGRYEGKTITFHCIRYKFKSADGKSSYEFDVGNDAQLPAITIPSIPALDLSTCIPSADSMKEKILRNDAPDEPEISFYTFSNSVENSIIAVTRTDYRYNGSYENLEIYDNEHDRITTNATWSYNGTNGTLKERLTKDGKEIEEIRNLLYCVNGQYYFANEDLEYPRVGSTTGLIDATFTLDYETGDEDESYETTVEFHVKNSSTVHIKVIINGITTEGDAIATYNNGVCTLYIPDSLKEIMGNEVYALYKGDALVPVTSLVECNSVPGYEDLLGE